MGSATAPRLAAWPIRLVESRSLADLEGALAGTACPILLIDLGQRPRAGLEELERATRAAPSALILVLDPGAHEGVALLARELGATHVYSGVVTPPAVARLLELLDRARPAATEADGWSSVRKPEPEPEPWNWLAPYLNEPRPGPAWPASNERLPLSSTPFRTRVVFFLFWIQRSRNTQSSADRGTLSMFGKNSSSLTEQDVLHALRGVQDPDLHRDLVDLGMIKNIQIGAGTVALTVNLTTPACPMKAKIEADVRGALTSRLGSDWAITVTMGAEVRSKGIAEKGDIPGVKNVIAVGSGKGESASRPWPPRSPMACKPTARRSA